MKSLERYHTRFCDHSLKLPTSLDVIPDMILVIPAYQESYESIFRTLHSLFDIDTYSGSVLVILGINCKASDPESVKLESRSLVNKVTTSSHFSRKGEKTLITFYLELEGKHAGVGLVRKKLMDLGFRIFYKYKKNGIIINLDADTFVKSNYFDAIESYFASNPEKEALSIGFEHNVDNWSINQEEFACVLYELHLRYFIHMQRILQLPYAYQTVGSAMAVRAYAYAKEGGMNKRQAGEDFYFLHKFSKNHTLGETGATIVVPSARRSDRVPFGTGKAIADMLNLPDVSCKSYNPQSFEILESWLQSIVNQSDTISINTPNPIFEQYLEIIDATMHIKSIKRQTTTEESFKKRFFQWFDAFALMKYLHYMRDHGYEDQDIQSCVEYLFTKLELTFNQSPFENLLILRRLDNS